MANSAPLPTIEHQRSLSVLQSGHALAVNAHSLHARKYPALTMSINKAHFI
jgi:hypothetical protein